VTRKIEDSLSALRLSSAMYSIHDCTKNQAAR
jgi:hypothetical protein